MNRNLSVLVLLIALIAVNIEIDIFLPSLPEMQDYFHVNEGTIEHILSINFLGLCFSGIFSGWLSDRFGRKPILVIGMIIFAVGSTGCAITSSFHWFLTFRLIQGIGCAAPATLSFAAICDIYSGGKAAQLISFFNGVITIAMVGAPVLGVALNSYWGWRSNFIFIAILSILSLLLLLTLFRETLKRSSRQPLVIKMFKQDITTILLNNKFWQYSLIAILMYSSLITFLANLSLLSINHFHFTQFNYGVLQSLVMLSFVLGSFFCTYLLRKFSEHLVVLWGHVLSVLGSLSLLSVIFISPSSLMLAIIISCFNCGAAFLIAVFSSKVIQEFSRTKGIISSVVGSLRMLVSALFITLSSLVFNGTFQPLGWLIFVATFASLGLAYSIKDKQNERSLIT